MALTIAGVLRIASSIIEPAMDSHTVPRFLLDQFAYDDTVVKKSRRLWQYTKGRAPWGFASPKTATRIPGHFSDPANAEREAKLETRLNQEFENPVHQFLPLFRFRTFAPSRLQIRQMTRYITLLWNRSQNRRKATKEQIAVSIESTRAFIADEQKLERIAGRWTLEILGLGVKLDRPVSAAEVRESAQKMIATMRTEEHQQTAYVDSMQRAMANTEPALENGEWSTIQTDLEHPFVIGDAPVVTWQRQENGVLEYGLGFHTPNVEVLLPIGPTACVQVLPAVQWSGRPQRPRINEINHAQAAFATKYCYAHKNDPSIDKVLQSIFSKRQIGVNAFSVRHKNYNDTMFEILMSGGSSFRTSRR